MDRAVDFAEWVKENPPPDLQELVAKYGTYSAIPEGAWRDFYRRRDLWESRRRDRLGIVQQEPNAS